MKLKVLALLLLAHIAGSYCVLLFDRFYNYDIPGPTFLSALSSPVWMLPLLAYLVVNAIGHGTILEAVPFLVAYQLPFYGLALFDYRKWARGKRRFIKGFPLNEKRG